MGIRVLLADAHKPYCDALCCALQQSPDVGVVMKCGSDQAAMVAMGRNRFDTVCMDMRLPVHGGVGTTRMLLQRFPQARVIGLSVHDDPVLVQEMFAAGATGFVLKMDAGMCLADAIRRVLAHERYISPGVCASAGMKLQLRSAR